MNVRIASGTFQGFVGHLSYDEEGLEWITFWTADGWRDVQARWIAV